MLDKRVLLIKFDWDFELEDEKDITGDNAIFCYLFNFMRKQE